MESDGRREAAVGRPVELILGSRVREFRQAAGYTQEALAAWLTAAGYPLHQTTVAKLENGTRPTSVGEVAALSTLFRVPIGEFFTTSGDLEPYVALARLAIAIELKEQELEDLADRQVALQRQLDNDRLIYAARKQAVAAGKPFDDLTAEQPGSGD